ncbi:hypothetical protein QQ045_000615 [Rhodiola kirilowii]
MAQTSASASANPTPVVLPINPADDPLYASVHKNVSSPLVSQVLLGSANFIPWCKSMEVALGVKMKLDFARGLVPRPTDAYRLSRWERCNNVILSWLMSFVSMKIGASLIHSRDCIHAWSHLNMKFGGSYGPSIYALQEEIYALKQGDLSIASYFRKLETLWAEEDALTEYVVCDLGRNCKMSKYVMTKKDMDRVMKFLMGLNDVYKAVRTQILHAEPMPPIDKVYKTLITEEFQRGLSRSPVPEISAIYVGQSNNTNQSSFHNNNNDNYNRQNTRNNTAESTLNRSRRLFCNHCQTPGHSRDTCYKLHGYPPGHRLHKSQGMSNSNKGNNKSSVNNVITNHTPSAGQGNKENSVTQEANEQ